MHLNCHKSQCARRLLVRVEEHTPVGYQRGCRRLARAHGLRGSSPNQIEGTGELGERRADWGTIEVAAVRRDILQPVCLHVPARVELSCRRSIAWQVVK